MVVKTTRVIEGPEACARGGLMYDCSNLKWVTIGGVAIEGYKQKQKCGKITPFFWPLRGSFNKGKKVKQIKKTKKWKKNKQKKWTRKPSAQQM
jgi:hypothetical protein